MSGYAGYTNSDNERRKSNNIETGCSTGGAVGRRTKAYGGSGPSAATKEEIQMKLKTLKNPVKIWFKIAGVLTEKQFPNQKEAKKFLALQKK